MERFFNFLKSAVSVLTIVLQVIATVLAAYDATQAETAGA
jgi:hypothetical protein